MVTLALGHLATILSVPTTTDRQTDRQTHHCSISVRSASTVDRLKKTVGLFKEEITCVTHV